MATRRGINGPTGQTLAGNHPRNPNSDYQQLNLGYYDSLFKNTDYWDLYQSILTQYGSPVPDTILGSLTGQNQMNEYNRRQKLGEALSALVSQMRVDEYNSPANQVALEKEAGLNPDITGVSGVGETQATQTPQHEPILNENPIPHMVSFLSMIGSAVAGSQAMISQKLINDSQRLNNLTMADNIVLGELGRLDLSFSENEIAPAFTVGFKTGNKQLDKKLEDRAQRLANTISHKISTKSNEKNLAEIRKGTYDIVSSAGYSDDDEFYNELAGKMADAYLKIQELQMRNQKKGLNVEKQRMENESEYLEEFDPTMQAGAENEANKRSKNKDSQWNEFFNIQKGIIGYIRSQAKKGDTGAIDLIFRIFGEDVGTNSNLSSLTQMATIPAGTISNLFK